eukprot:1383092-Amorphochlora_amoeboformis.AAC.1
MSTSDNDSSDFYSSAIFARLQCLRDPDCANSKRLEALEREEEKILARVRELKLVKARIDRKIAEERKFLQSLEK